MHLIKILCLLGCFAASISAESSAAFAQSRAVVPDTAPQTPPDVDEPDDNPAPPSPRDNPRIRPPAPPNPPRMRRNDDGLNAIRRAERRAQWQQRKFAREQARQRWLAASSVNCYQHGALIVN